MDFIALCGNPGLRWPFELEYCGRHHGTGHSLGGGCSSTCAPVPMAYVAHASGDSPHPNSNGGVHPLVCSFMAWTWNFAVVIVDWIVLLMTLICWTIDWLIVLIIDWLILLIDWLIDWIWIGDVCALAFTQCSVRPLGAVTFDWLIVEGAALW